MGEGEAFFKGRRLPGDQALQQAGIPIPGLEVRDGLACINGSNLLNGIGALAVFDAERWLKQAEIATAMSLEALKANMKPYDTRLHELRGFAGAVTCAANLRRIMDGCGSDHRQRKGQGAGRLLDALHAAGDRCRPRPTSLDTFRRSKSRPTGLVTTRYFSPEDQVVLSGAN